MLAVRQDHLSDTLSVGSGGHALECRTIDRGDGGL